jgi:hypothetical protein
MGAHKNRFQLATIRNGFGALHHTQGRMKRAKEQWEGAREVYRDILKASSAAEDSRPN